jgi:hypothetical protein
MTLLQFKKSSLGLAFSEARLQEREEYLNLKPFKNQVYKDLHTAYRGMDLPGLIYMGPDLGTNTLYKKLVLFHLETKIIGHPDYRVTQETYYKVMVSDFSNKSSFRFFWVNEKSVEPFNGVVDKHRDLCKTLLKKYKKQKPT